MVRARGTDSSNNTTNATPANLTIDNGVDQVPTVDLVTPAPNTVMSGDYLILVEAHDAEDADATLQVEVDYGAGWVPAIWKAGKQQFQIRLDTTTRPDGSITMRARVTDSANQTAQTADVPMKISNSAYVMSVLNDNPKTYWRFNETSGDFADDSRWANVNGTYIGVNPNSGTLLEDGEPGSAARFDGVNDWVRLPNHKAYNTGGPYGRRTIELWFEADNTNGRQVLFEAGAGSRGMNIYLAGDRLYAGAWNLTDDDGSTPWGPVFAHFDGIQPKTTYYVAVTLTSKGDRLHLFVNGQWVDAESGVGRLHPHSRSAIGGVVKGTRFHDGISNPQGYYYDGKIDEVAIYNRTFSGAHIGQRWDIGMGVA